MPPTRSSTLTSAAALAVALVAIGAGCAANGYPGLSRRDRSEGHTLRVRNDNWLDVRIYLVQQDGAAPQRLGSVSGMSTETVRLPLVTDRFVRFLLRPIGSRVEYLTTPIYLEPGRTVQLTVANALTQSNLSAR